MTLTLNLRPELEERLQKMAEECGQDSSEYVLSILEEVLVEPVENEPMPTNGAELVAYWRRKGLIGDWADREDIVDSQSYARMLREQAQTRSHDR